MLAERKALERGGDLINLLHTRSHWPSTDEDDDISVPHFAMFDRSHGAGFCDKNPSWSRMDIRSVFVEKRRVDGCAFDYAALGRKIAYREAQSSSKAAGARAVDGKNNVMRIDAVERQKTILHRSTALAGFPPVEIFAEGFSGHGAHGCIRRPGAPQVQHRFG